MASSLARMMIGTIGFEPTPEPGLSREWYRASGGVVCNLCGLEYRAHPPYPYDTDGRSYDIELCNGDVVHL